MRKKERCEKVEQGCCVREMCVNVVVSVVCMRSIDRGLAQVLTPVFSARFVPLKGEGGAMGGGDTMGFCQLLLIAQRKPLDG